MEQNVWRASICVPDLSHICGGMYDLQFYNSTILIFAISRLVFEINQLKIILTTLG